MVGMTAIPQGCAIHAMPLWKAGQVFGSHLVNQRLLTSIGDEDRV
jgi:hypothetical protein